MVRFLHTSDWQLGMTRHFLEGEAQARFAQDRIDGIRKLIRVASDHDCAFIVVAGDVFETNQVSMQTIVRTLEALHSSSIPVYLLAGNHDPLSPLSVYHSNTFQRHCPECVTVMEPNVTYFPQPGIAVGGAPWRDKHPHKDPVEDGLKNLLEAEARLRILVGHGGLDQLSPDASHPALIQSAPLQQAMDAGQLHYVALGDRHSFTRLGASGRIVYSGAHVATDYREEDPGKVAVVTLEEDDLHVEAVSVGNWKFVTMHPPLNGDDDLSTLRETLLAIPDKERTVVRLAPKGSLSVQQWIRYEELFSDGQALFASLRIWERHTDLIMVPDDQDFADWSLQGYVAEARNVLLAHAENGHEPSGDALRLLFRLMRHHA